MWGKVCPCQIHMQINVCVSGLRHLWVSVWLQKRQHNNQTQVWDVIVDGFFMKHVTTLGNLHNYLKIKINTS